MPAFSPLTFDVRNPAIRSAREEWKPHARMSEKSYEWWYVTANLEGPDGTAYGVQWTLFRQAISPDPAADGWGAPQVWMGHAALTTPSVHVAAEQFGRGGGP